MQAETLAATRLAAALAKVRLAASCQKMCILYDSPLTETEMEDLMHVLHDAAGDMDALHMALPHDLCMHELVQLARQ